MRANEIAVEGSRQEALVGQRTTLDVLDQEQDLFQSQVDLVQARRDQIVASYRLKAAVGELTVAGIDLPVEPYKSGSLLRGRAQPAVRTWRRCSMAGRLPIDASGLPDCGPMAPRQIPGGRVT